MHQPCIGQFVYHTKILFLLLIVISASEPEPEIVISDDDDENLPIKELLEKKVLGGCKKSPEVNGETCEIVSDDENLPIKELLEKKALSGCNKSPEVNGKTCEIVSDESLSAEDVVVIRSNYKTDKSKTNSNGNWWKTPVKGKITT